MNSTASATPAFVIGYFLALAIATFAAYSSIGGSEILRWDDNVYLHHELVQSLDFDNLLAMLYTQHHSNWHPLTTLSFAIENALWGNNAVYAKITNICLHLLASFLFYLLSFRLLLLATEPGRKLPSQHFGHAIFADRNRFALFASLFAATLFALHPQHVESVAWVSERKGLLCAVFYLAALISYVRTSTQAAGLHLNLTLVFMLLALMSKPMAVSLPVAMMLLDIYPLGKVERLRPSLDTLLGLLRGKMIYILLSLASVIITLLYQDPQGEAVFGYLPRLINACAAYWHYLLSIFYPVNLSPFYPFAEFSRHPSAFSLVPVFTFIALVTASIVMYLKKMPFAMVVIGYFTISLLPVIGIVKVGHQAMADRYAYLPAIFFYLLIGVAIYILCAICRHQLQRLLLGAAFVVICVSLAFVTHTHTQHWRDDIALWQRVVDLYPDTASIAYVNLASAYDARGGKSAEEIEQLIQRGLEIEPDNPYNLGAAANFYGQLENTQKSFEYLLRMAEVAPYNYWSRTQIADIYFNRRDYINAGNYYIEALRIGEDSEEVIYRLALIDFHFKRYNDVLAKLDLLTKIEFTQKKYRLQKKVEKALSQAGGSSQ